MKDLFDFKPGWPATFSGIPAMADFSIDGYCVFDVAVDDGPFADRSRYTEPHCSVLSGYRQLIARRRRLESRNE